MRTNDISRAITDALEATGLPWAIEHGRKHRKVLVCGRLAGILPTYLSKGGSNPDTGRSTKNLVSQIRRAAERFKQESRK